MPPANLVPPLSEIENEAWRSEYTPSQHTRQELQELRKTYLERMKATNELAASLRADLENIESQHQELESRIEKLDSAISPWKNLPSEILSLIFEHLQEGKRIHLNVAYSGRDQGSKITFPELVCSRWREVALDTPSIWERVEVDYVGLDMDSEAWDDLTNQAVNFISRGARELILHFSDIDLDYATEYLKQLVSPCTSRLTSLNIGHLASDSTFLSSVTSLLPSLPMLSRFEDTLQDGGGNRREPLSFCLAASPNKLLDNITSLQIGGSNSHVFVVPSELFRILELCPNLSRLGVGLCRNEVQVLTPPESPSPQIVYPKIKHFEINFKGRWPEGAMSILDALALPALRHLSLCAAYRSKAEITPADVLSFLDQSRCTLLYFTVSDHVFSEADLELLLSRLPSLEGLSLNPTLMTPAIFNKIATAELLPKVRNLKGQILGNPATIDALTSLAEMRWEKKNGTDIQTIFCEYKKVAGWIPPPFSPEWKEKFQPRGRQVEIQPLPWWQDL